MSRCVRHVVVTVFSVALFLPTAVLANDALERYQTIRDDYLDLREDPERQRFRHNYLRILDRFEEFVSDHPDHERAPAALYNSGKLAWDLYKVSRVPADLRRARELFVRLADAYPEDDLADDGLFLSGRILVEHGGDAREAYEIFKAVVERFPAGDMVPKAREMISQLQESSALEPAPEPSRDEVARVIARSGGWEGRVGGASAVVGRPSVEANQGFVRVSLPMTGQVRHRQGEVPADRTRGLPRRVYLDLQPARIEGPPVSVQGGKTLISGVRLAQYTTDTVRLVVDLVKDDPVSLFPLQAEDSLIIDVTGDTRPTSDPIRLVAGVAARRAAGTLSGKGSSSKAESDAARQVRDRLKQPQEVPLSVQAGLKVRRVVIDPGHGGRDYGAVGPTGLREKDVTLDISKRLGELLDDHGLEVVYTRTDDVFVALEDRTAIANQEKADLFISVHANAASRADRRGISTYYLDVTSDRYAMRLAARENATSKRSVGELQLILADLATRHNTDESARLAERIQENLVRTISEQHGEVRDLGVRYALFFVLLGARMPSVLVETSFISNPREERLLADEAYREHLSRGIFEGVLAFIEDRNQLALGL